MTIALSPELACLGQAAVTPREVADCSEVVRSRAKAATVVVRDEALLAGVVGEQAGATQSFPGPLPVLFRPPLGGPNVGADIAAALQTAVSTRAAAARARSLAVRKKKHPPSLY